MNQIWIKTINGWIFVDPISLRVSKNVEGWTLTVIAISPIDRNTTVRQEINYYKSCEEANYAMDMLMNKITTEHNDVPQFNMVKGN